jgi:MFS family permease
MIRALAISLISVFIPVYLYSTLNSSIAEIIYFYILYFLIILLASPFSAHLISKIGFKHTIFVSSIFYIVSFTLLDLIKKINTLPMFLSTAIAFGLASSLYWIAFHVDFAKYTKKKYRGTQIALWKIFAALVAIIGPVLAGLILDLYSFNVLYLIGIGLLILSAVPLFFSRDQHIKSHFSYSYIFQKENLKEGIIFGVAGAKLLTQVMLWPFFIYLIILEYLKFGSTIAVISILALLSYIVIGKLSDKVSSSKLLRTGALLHLLASLFLGFVQTIPI